MSATKESLEPGFSNPREYISNKSNIIFSDGKAVDVSQIILELVIHQTMDSPYMYGHVIIADTQSLMNKFSMNGYEFLDISYDRSTADSPIEGKFSIYLISDRKPIQGGEVYKMHFCSRQSLISDSTVISKAYYRSAISDIVADILINYLDVPEKNIILEETAGAYDIVVADKRPFEAITWLASRAYNYNNDPAYAYHFYQTRDGYTFTSLQRLFQQPVKKTYRYDLKLISDTPNQTSDIRKNMNSILRMQVTRDFDTKRALFSGSYSNQMTVVNLVNREFETKVYSVSDQTDLLLNKHVNTNNPLLLDSPACKETLYVKTPETKEEVSNDVDIWMNNAILHGNLCRTQKVFITVSGDLTVKPGDIVKLDMPLNTPPFENTKDFDEAKSGKYIVGDVSHIFREDGLFDTNIELWTNSFAESLPSGI